MNVLSGEALMTKVETINSDLIRFSTRYEDFEEENDPFSSKMCDDTGALGELVQLKFDKPCNTGCIH